MGETGADNAYRETFDDEFERLRGKLVGWLGTIFVERLVGRLLG